MAVSSTFDSSALAALNGNAGAAVKASATDELRDSFMTLLVEQLQNQDPMNPMENAEMTSQLAQVNTAAGVADLNSTLSGITEQIDAGRSLEAAALIGKGVLVPGDRVLLGSDGEATPFGIELQQGADQVDVTIVDGNGNVMRKLDAFSMPAGVESFPWDGQMDNGAGMAPAGAYRIVVAASANGEPVEAMSLNYAQVSGVSTHGNGAPRLDLGGISDQVALTDIRQIF